jgi:hypothetical protein
MGEMVNIVKPDGTVVTVDRDVAEALTGQKLAPHMQTPEEKVEAARTEYNRDNTSAVQAGLASAANTAFFGAPGMFYSEETREGIRVHPTAAKIGSLAAVVAPTGLLGKGAKAVSEATILGQAAKIGAGGGVAGRAVEGGIIGGGLHMADASLSDDPLSAEALVESIGMGSLLSVGLGAATDKALKLFTPKVTYGSGVEGLLPGAKAVIKRGPAPLAEAARARAALDEAEAVASSVREEATMAAIVRQAKADVEASKQALDELPEYAAFRDSYNTAQQVIAKSNKVAEQTAADFAEWAKPGGLKATLNEYEGVQGKIRSQIQKLRAKDPTGMLGASRRDAARAAGEPVPMDETSALIGVARDIDDVKSFSKNLIGSEDIRAANAIYSKMQNVNARLTELGVKTPKLPELPTGEVQELGSKLPDMLTDLGKLKEESIAKIANALDANSQIAAVNLARSIGLDAETAGDALAGINRQMKDMYHGVDLSKAATQEAKAIAAADAKAAKAADKSKFSEASSEVDRAREVTGGRLEWTFKDGELAAGAVGSKEGSSILSGARKWTKAGLQSAAARAAYTGGWKGALVSRLAYGAAGYAVGGVDGALLGASVGSARAETVSRVRQVVVEAAKKGVEATSRLRPLAAYLGTRGADSDSSLYDGAQAKALIDSVHQQAITSHDAMYSMSKPLMGSPGDLAFKLYDKTTRAMAYLSQVAPKDPGIDITPSGSNWEPSPDEIHTWLHRY